MRVRARGAPTEGRRSVRAFLVVSLVAASIAACGAPGSGAVFFVEPLDGAVVSSPVRVEMGATDYTIEPVQEGVGAGRGHFHIIIDAPCVQTRLTVASDDRHLHFGGGQFVTELELDPGPHTLCLQAADGAHTATSLVDKITISVEE